MGKPAITLGIVLSLSLAGCAGFSVQQGPSLSSQLAETRGVEPLWDEVEAKPTQSLDAPRYADQHLDGLWDEYRAEPAESGKDDPEQGLLFGEQLSGPQSIRF